MSDLRAAYKKYSDPIREILRDPTDDEIAQLMPLDHPLDVKTMTVGQWLDFTKNLWKSVQTRQIISLLMEAEKQ